MASILALVGGAVINAAAFSGTNYLFSSLSDHGEAERRRYDLTLEQLTKNRSEWAQKHQQRLDQLYERAQETKNADQDLAASEELMREYDVLSKQKFEGKLSDYYNPSEGQKTGEILFITTGLGAIAYLIYRNK